MAFVVVGTDSWAAGASSVGGTGGGWPRRRDRPGPARGGCRRPSDTAGGGRVDGEGEVVVVAVVVVVDGQRVRLSRARAGANVATATAMRRSLEGAKRCAAGTRRTQHGDATRPVQYTVQ